MLNTETTLVYDSIYAAKESLCNSEKCFQKQLPFETDIFSTQHISIYLYIYILVFVYLICDDRPYAVSIWRPSKNSLRIDFRSPGKQRPAQEIMTSSESFFCTYEITAEEESSKHFQVSHWEHIKCMGHEISGTSYKDQTEGGCLPFYF